MPLLKQFNELGYLVHAKERGNIVDFEIYEIEGITEKGDVLLHKKDSPSYPDPVDTIEQADIFCHGSVKWDGCSDWYFDEQDSTYIHQCSRDGLINMGLILGECFDIAKELMDYFDGK